MCLSPITIINPSKYVSLRYRDRFLLQVPCGHCAQCQTNKSNEWYFRSYYHSLDVLNNNGYIIFDTLTYNNDHLPRFSDFFDVPKSLDFTCFNSRDITLFIKRLRKQCSKFGSTFTYFLTSEYGTSEYYTKNGKLRKSSHRPHYHVLFYCDGKLDRLLMSRMIADCWYFGRTDGIKYKPSSYVLNNIFTSNNFDASLRTCRYVSKYIQKSCKFQRVINNRIDSIMNYIDKRMNVDGWKSSIHANIVREKLYRLANQFHRQSLGFGASYLRDLDIDDIIRTNQISMPDSKRITMRIPLPSYYKRKLFYKTIKVDGCDIWIPNEIGIEYLKKRDVILHKNLLQRVKASSIQANIKIDPIELSNYILDTRGRIRASKKSLTPLDKIQHCDLYNYSHRVDKFHLDDLGLTNRFVGNSKLGYRYSKLYNRIAFRNFVAKFVFLDEKLEKQLDDISNAYKDIDVARQKAFELTQRLTNLYHHLNL